MAYSRVLPIIFIQWSSLGNLVRENPQCFPHLEGGAARTRRNRRKYSSFKHLCNTHTHTQMGKPQCKPQCKHGLLYLSMSGLFTKFAVSNHKLASVVVYYRSSSYYIYRGCLLHRYNYRGCLLHRHETENGVPEVCTWSITHTH